MQKAEPDEYNFMPNTWVLPQEFGYFSNYARKLYRQGCNACFIQKPANGAMGHGWVNESYLFVVFIFIVIELLFKVNDCFK